MMTIRLLWGKNNWLKNELKNFYQSNFIIVGQTVGPFELLGTKI